MSERVTRSQTGKTPRKSTVPDGFVETPGVKRRSRKSQAASSQAASSDERSPSPSDNVPPPALTLANGKGPSTLTLTRDNEQANKKLKEGKIIDGWRVGSDPKIDADPHFDFGGTWGVSAMMIGFPTLMWYMWVGATYYDGKFPSEPSMTWTQFGKHLVHLAYTGAFPHAKAWAIYWTFFIFEGILYLVMPGVYSTGKPLHHEGGKQLRYYCSGVASFYFSIFVAGILHFTGLFPLYTLIDEFGPIMSVAIISGFLVAIVAYVSAILRGAQHRMTGYPIYDFFMGAELNPRMFDWLDFKMFFEVRLPWYILFFTTLSACARQYELYGYVSGEVGFLLMAHWLYANACSKGEEMIVTTWDIYYEKWGFMLIFWNLAGVPLSYCHCTIYLANRDPATYAWNKPFLAFMYISYLFAYWVWDTGNSQKNFFRAQEKGQAQDRRTFPQLPWKFVPNAKHIETDTGDSILVDGWFQYVRKPHYTADVWFAFCWGLITGFESPFPWFYPAFFIGMICHRAIRDVQRCRRKYGDAWVEYERRVPYMFFPYLF
ncbi:unnamed protein product [Zymoseptoria tritici ST99CH_1E4]|uniref:Delta(24(24(1)))-sterol reductase n=1 Tax=Zymoseptoria tritici ST99CH_1E4 TaxID=1276532 RepID=A0A2H1H7Y3_ZYMTR|nr:unnamed protein product [Zymoseptoria tritici ST99CH_1E4]